MKFWKPFTFIFEDPDWMKKIGKLALVSFASIVIFFGWIFVAFVYMGVFVDLIRKVINKEKVVIPDLDVRNQFKSGFKLWVINLVYSLPVVAVSIFASILSVIAGIAGLKGSEIVGVLFMIANVCLYLLMGLYGLVYALITPEILSRFAVHGTIKSGLELKSIFKTVFSHLGSYIVALLGAVVAMILIYFAIVLTVPMAIVYFVLPAIGLFIVFCLYLYLMMVIGHFYGQAHNLATDEVI